MFGKQTPRQATKPALLKSRLKAVMTAAVLGIVAAGCVTNQPVLNPCGVIADSLKTVQSTDKDGQKRLDIHFERGVAAGCWDRKTGELLTKKAGA